MWEAAERAADDPTIETDAAVFAEAREAVPNMLDSPDGVAEYIGERLAAPREQEEPTASVVGEDGTERPGFNVDTSEGRESVIDRRLAGEDVVAYDSSYDIEGDE